LVGDRHAEGFLGKGIKHQKGKLSILRTRIEPKFQFLLIAGKAALR
jgi:hypothetical protein